MMKYKTKIAVMICAVMVAISFGGCQLAKPDMTKDIGGDAFIGIFVTINERLPEDESIEETEITSIEQLFEDDARYYATLVTEEVTHSLTGEKHMIEEYVFEGIDGSYLFVAEMEDEEGKYSHTTNKGMSDTHQNAISKDGEDRMELTGTIYVDERTGGDIYYFNPISQSPDGSVYVQNGSGISSSVDGEDGFGGRISSNQESSITSTVNGESVIKSMFVEIAIEGVSPPERINIIEMDKDYDVITNTEYVPGELPEELSFSEGVEFVIVEHHSVENEAGSEIERDTYGREDDGFETFYLEDSGVIISEYTKLEWL